MIAKADDIAEELKTVQRGRQGGWGGRISTTARALTLCPPRTFFHRFLKPFLE